MTNKKPSSKRRKPKKQQYVKKPKLGLHLNAADLVFRSYGTRGEVDEAQVQKMVVLLEDEDNANYGELLDMWDENYALPIAQTQSLSVLKPFELSLLNRLFKSKATCFYLHTEELKKAVLQLMRMDYFHNFRKFVAKKFDVKVIVEDWIWSKTKAEFEENLDSELISYENLLMSLQFYLLGGFQLPRDSWKPWMDEWVSVEQEEILRRPRVIFLLSKIPPSILSRYVYWKTTCVQGGLSRLYTKPDLTEALHKLHEILKHTELQDGTNPDAG